MKRYLHEFQTQQEFEEAYNGDGYYEPWVSYVVENGHVDYNMLPEERLRRQPLTFIALEDGTFKFSGSTTANTLSYSLDGGETWTELANDDEPVEVLSGKTIMWKGTPTPQPYRGIGKFISTGNFDVEGNTMSVIYGDDFKNQTILTNKEFALFGLFNANKVVSVENIIIPDTLRSQQSYGNMFKGCTNLTTASFVLYTNGNGDLTFANMFAECTSLMVAPHFVGDYVGYNVCSNMFSGCTSLTTAPELPATTLGQNCYQYMFRGCTSLTTAPSVLPATTLPLGCCEGMFYGCTGLTVGPTSIGNSSTTVSSSSCRFMFSGCTSLTTAPELPATTLGSDCYYGMFLGCTSLTTAPELPATTLASGCYNIMFKDCTSLTTAPELPATTLADGCYRYMFQGCTGLTSAPSILPATTLISDCYSCMFSGCSSLTTAPELPATTLADSCYGGMFQGCRSLNYIKCLATDISATYCTSNWVYGVASSGTFVKNANMSDWTTGANGIPNNWTVGDATS